MNSSQIYASISNQPLQVSTIVVHSSAGGDLQASQNQFEQLRPFNALRKPKEQAATEYTWGAFAAYISYLDSHIICNAVLFIS